MERNEEIEIVHRENHNDNNERTQHQIQQAEEDEEPRYLGRFVFVIECYDSPNL